MVETGQLNQSLDTILKMPKDRIQEIIFYLNKQANSLLITGCLFFYQQFFFKTYQL